MDTPNHGRLVSCDARKKARRSGLTLIEVSISMMIAATVLLASARAFTATLKASNQARRTTDAAVFLETAMEDIGAQPFDAVLTLNGETLFDGADLDSSHYTITIDAFLVEPDLLQINANVFDRTTGLVAGRLSSQRTRR